MERFLALESPASLWALALGSSTCLRALAVGSFTSLRALAVGFSTSLQALAVGSSVSLRALFSRMFVIRFLLSSLGTSYALATSLNFASVQGELFLSG